MEVMTLILYLLATLVVAGFVGYFVMVRYDNKFVRLSEEHERIVEEAEKALDNYARFFLALDEKVNSMYDAMKALDVRGAFEADDEVGYFFIELKAIMSDLSLFFGNEVEEVDVEQEVSELEENIENERIKRIEAEKQKFSKSKFATLHNRVTDNDVMKRLKATDEKLRSKDIVTKEDLENDQ